MRRVLLHLRELRGRVLRHRDRGAVAVEAAIVAPILLLLVIGIVEFGYAYKDQLTITSAVRSGARIASSMPRNTGFAQAAANAVAAESSNIDMADVEALWVYKADASGHPGSSTSFAACTSNCIQFAWNGSAFVQTAGSWPATSQNACVGTEDSLGVYLKFKHVGLTTTIFNSLGLNSYTVMRLEPIPAMTVGGCGSTS